MLIGAEVARADELLGEGIELEHLTLRAGEIDIGVAFEEGEQTQVIGEPPEFALLPMGVPQGRGREVGRIDDEDSVLRDLTEELPIVQAHPLDAHEVALGIVGLAGGPVVEVGSG